MFLKTIYVSGIIRKADFYVLEFFLLKLKAHIPCSKTHIFIIMDVMLVYLNYQQSIRPLPQLHLLQYPKNEVTNSKK